MILETLHELLNQLLQEVVMGRLPLAGPDHLEKEVCVAQSHGEVVQPHCSFPRLMSPVVSESLHSLSEDVRPSH